MCAITQFEIFLCLSEVARTVYFEFGQIMVRIDADQRAGNLLNEQDIQFNANY